MNDDRSSEHNLSSCENDAQKIYKNGFTGALLGCFKSFFSDVGDYCTI